MVPRTGSGEMLGDGSVFGSGEGEGSADGEGSGEGDGSGVGVGVGSGDGDTEGSGADDGSGASVGDSGGVGVGSRTGVGVGSGAGVAASDGASVGSMAPTVGTTGVNARAAVTMRRRAPKRGPARCWIVRRCVMTVVLRPSVPPGRGSRPGAGRRLGGPAWRRPANNHLWKLDQGRTGAGVGPTWVPAVIVPVGS